MTPFIGDPKSRRRFLQMLAASPLVHYARLPHAVMKALQQDQNPGGNTDDVLHVQDPDGMPGTVLKSMQEYDDHLASAKDAITVFDLEVVARKKLDVGHLGYLLGTEDASTYMANREGFTRLQLRPRRLVDTKNIDMSVSLIGTKWNTPIFLCPIGYQAAFNPQGELATARAAKAKGVLQMMSSAKTRGILKRAEAAGCPAIFLTVDASGGDKREALARIRRQNSAHCATCHTLIENEGLTERALSGPGFMNPGGAWSSTPPVGPPTPETVPLSWDYVKKLKDATPMKLFIKGIVSREDAELAVQHGVDGVWISNHGGHAENSGRGTIECLPEVAAGVAGRVPIIIDGGFRRGVDIYKALALGATAIGFGRPCAWGLASFGQDGVEAALDIMTTELRMVMGQMGATSVSQIKKDSVIPRPA